MKKTAPIIIYDIISDGIGKSDTLNIFYVVVQNQALKAIKKYRHLQNLFDIKSAMTIQGGCPQKFKIKFHDYSMIIP